MQFGKLQNGTVNQTSCVAIEGNMKRILIGLTILLCFPFATPSRSNAAVYELRLGYDNRYWSYPEFISYEYQKHQVSFSFSQGESHKFEIGMANIDGPASLFIDKIELTGPAGNIAIFNSNFENGSSGWTAMGSHYAQAEFAISTEAYEGSKAGKVTLFSTGSYSIYTENPVSIPQTGTYTLSVYTKVQEAQREIPPNAIFAMDVANQWVYDGSVTRQIEELDHFSFGKDTFKLKIFQEGIPKGYEWYEVWKGYTLFWGFYDNSVTYKFSDGLLVGWIPVNAGESKRSLSWVLNYGVEVDLTATFLGSEQITLNFDTFEAYKFRYNFTFTGPGGTTTTSYDWWFVPYIGVVKQQTSGGVANLISFSILGGTVSEVSDNDQDSLLDYKELTTYHTDPLQGDTDLDGCQDGAEVQVGRNPLIADSQGDVNGDCVVTMADAISALRLITGIDELGPSSKEAEVNGDGKIGFEELIWILQSISGSR